jgi:hypothetical protein
MDCSDIPKGYGRGRGYSPDVRAMGATSGLDSILLQPSESEFDNGMRKLWRHCRITPSSGVRGG